MNPTPSLLSRLSPNSSTSNPSPPGNKSQELPSSRRSRGARKGGEKDHPTKKDSGNSNGNGNGNGLIVEADGWIGVTSNSRSSFSGQGIAANIPTAPLAMRLPQSSNPFGALPSSPSSLTMSSPPSSFKASTSPRSHPNNKHSHPVLPALSSSPLKFTHLPALSPTRVQIGSKERDTTTSRWASNSPTTTPVKEGFEIRIVEKEVEVRGIEASMATLSTEPTSTKVVPAPVTSSQSRWATGPDEVAIDTSASIPSNGTTTTSTVSSPSNNLNSTSPVSESIPSTPPFVPTSLPPTSPSMRSPEPAHINWADDDDDLGDLPELSDDWISAVPVAPILSPLPPPPTSPNSRHNNSNRAPKKVPTPIKVTPIFNPKILTRPAQQSIHSGGGPPQSLKSNPTSPRVTPSHLAMSPTARFGTGRGGDGGGEGHHHPSRGGGGGGFDSPRGRNHYGQGGGRGGGPSPAPSPIIAPTTRGRGGGPTPEAFARLSGMSVRGSGKGARGGRGGQTGEMASGSW